MSSSIDRWHGDTNFDKADYVRHAGQFYGLDPPSSSSAVVETVFRKPREYADVNEYGTVPSTDRVLTAVGFHSLDSMDEIQDAKSRCSRYEIEEERVEDEDDRDAAPETSSAPSSNDSKHSSELDLGSSSAADTVKDEPSYFSEGSDSCPAVWRSASEEGLVLPGRDYEKAVEQAKRVKALNEVRANVSVSSLLWPQQDEVESHHSASEAETNDGNMSEDHNINGDGEWRGEEETHMNEPDEPNTLFPGYDSKSKDKSSSSGKSNFAARLIRQLNPFHSNGKVKNGQKTLGQTQAPVDRSLNSKQQGTLASDRRVTKAAEKRNVVASKSTPPAVQSRPVNPVKRSSERNFGPVDLDDIPTTESETTGDVSFQRTVSGGKSSSYGRNTSELNSHTTDSKLTSFNLASQSNESREAPAMIENAMDNLISNLASQSNESKEATAMIENATNNLKSRSRFSLSSRSTKLTPMAVFDAISVGSKSEDQNKSRSLTSDVASKKSQDQAYSRSTKSGTASQKSQNHFDSRSMKSGTASQKSKDHSRSSKTGATQSNESKEAIAMTKNAMNNLKSRSRFSWSSRSTKSKRMAVVDAISVGSKHKDHSKSRSLTSDVASKQSQDQFHSRSMTSGIASHKLQNQFDSRFMKSGKTSQKSKDHSRSSRTGEASQKSQDQPNSIVQHASQSQGSSIKKNENSVTAESRTRNLEGSKSQRSVSDPPAQEEKHTGIFLENGSGNLSRQQVDAEPEQWTEEIKSQNGRSKISNQSSRMTFDDEYDNMTSPPPVREIIPIIQDTNARPRSRQPGQEYAVDYCKEGNSAVHTAISSMPSLTNDDIIEAVRGQNNVSQGEIENVNAVGEAFDGFTSWIISGFDSLANLASPGQEDPIGLLDWSGEATKGCKVQAGTGGRSKGEHHKPRKIETSVKPSTLEELKGISVNASRSGQDIFVPASRSVEGIPGSNHAKQHQDSQLMTQNNYAQDLTRGDRAALPSQSRKAVRSTTPMGSGFIQQFQQFLGGGTTARQKNDEAPTTEVVATRDVPLETGNMANHDDASPNGEPPLRGLVSISSIEIPTLQKGVKKEDECSVSLLGLEKEKKDQNPHEQSKNMVQKHSHVTSDKQTKQRKGTASGKSSEAKKNQGSATLRKGRHKQVGQTMTPAKIVATMWRSERVSKE